MIVNISLKEKNIEYLCVFFYQYVLTLKLPQREFKILEALMPKWLELESREWVSRKCETRTIKKGYQNK